MTFFWVSLFFWVLKTLLISGTRRFPICIPHYARLLLSGDEPVFSFFTFRGVRLYDFNWEYRDGGDITYGL